jgi:hypothetical protein
MSRPSKYPHELHDRGVRLVFESGRPIAHVNRVPRTSQARWQELGQEKLGSPRGCSASLPGVSRASTFMPSCARKGEVL